MNIKTIEQRILEKADADLKREVENWIKPFQYNLGDYDKPVSLDMTIHGLPHKAALEKQGTILPLLKHMLITHLTPARRAQALDAFVNKVNRLAVAYEELGLYHEEDTNEQPNL